MLNKKIIFILSLSFCIVTALAQDYKTGIGVRLGGLTSGLTLRGFTNSSTAFEGIASFGHRSFILTGLYEKFKPVSNAQGLNWFYGGGAHMGFFQYGGRYWVINGDGRKIYVQESGNSRTVIGADFIIGIDYKFNNAPLNIGLDLKPFVDFIDGVQGYYDGALSLRFVF